MPTDILERTVLKTQGALTRLARISANAMKATSRWTQNPRSAKTAMNVSSK